jgi:hypothetical protein
VGRPAIDPDASAYDVLAIYGALMQQVQAFEVLLAALALLVEADPNRVSNAGLERQMRSAIAKGVHAFQNGSPAASRDRVKGHLAPELEEEVVALVPERNRLAHSFLIQQVQESSGGARFRPGTVLQIIEYAQRFAAINKKLELEMKRLTEELPGTPEEIANLIDRLARGIVLGEVAGTHTKKTNPA